ncbi:hypothetical protein [Sulfurimonas sp. NW9]
MSMFLMHKMVPGTLNRFDTQLDITYKLSKRLNKNVDIVILTG